MAEFEDNQNVTLESLNNIAIDLGDTTFSQFATAKFGVDELNEITKALVGKGILRTISGNNGTMEMGCNPTVSEEQLHIGSGVIVFDSGAKIRIIEPITIDYVPNTYVFAKNNTDTGKASIETALSLPESGDFVAIAKMKTNNAIDDLRSGCLSRALSVDAENVIKTKEVVIPSISGNETFTFDMGFAGFHFISTYYGGNVDAIKTLQDDTKVVIQLVKQASQDPVSMYATKNGSTITVRQYSSGTSIAGTYNVKVI